MINIKWAFLAVVMAAAANFYFGMRFGFDCSRSTIEKLRIELEIAKDPRVLRIVNRAIRTELQNREAEREMGLQPYVIPDNDLLSLIRDRQRAGVLEGVQ